MTTDLKDQIHSLMERGLQHVSAADAIGHTDRSTATFPAAGLRRRAGRTRWAVIAAATAAIACAGVLAVTQPGSRVPTRQAGQVVLTAAHMRHLESASQVALEVAGRAVIVSRVTQDGAVQSTNSDDITFTGGNWNDSFVVSTPTSAGGPASSESAVNRVVQGQAYNYFVANHGLAWYHDTGPNAIASMAIPDPRRLLSELSPAARFVRVGYSTIGGIRTEHLQATSMSELPSVQLGNATPSGKLTALDIWADSNGVVRRMTLTTRQVDSPKRISLKDLPKNIKVVGPAGKLAKSGFVRGWYHQRGQIILVLGTGKPAGQTLILRTSVTVSFLDIGQPQVIRVPAHAYLIRGLG